MKNLIAIPCFNEELNLESTIKKILDISNDKFEILVCNDGSTDSSISIIKKYESQIHFIESKVNFGLSEVFNSIMYFAKTNSYDNLIIFDADQQYPYKEIEHLLNNHIINKNDIHIGTRNFKKTRHFSVIKNFLQNLGSFVVSFFVKQRIKDVTSGFRIYSNRAIETLFSYNNFTYTVETLFQAKQIGLIIGTTQIESVNETRDSKLFNSNFEYVAKTSKIIFKSILVYRKDVNLKIFLLSLIPTILILNRFFSPYFKYGFNDGNIQSLIVGIGLLIIFIIILFSSYLLVSQYYSGLETKKYLYSPKHT